MIEKVNATLIRDAVNLPRGFRAERYGVDKALIVEFFSPTRVFVNVDPVACCSGLLPTERVLARAVVLHGPAPRLRIQKDRSIARASSVRTEYHCHMVPAAGWEGVANTLSIDFEEAAAEQQGAATPAEQYPRSDGHLAAKPECDGPRRGRTSNAVVCDVSSGGSG
jgi:hypothetical protein